VAPRPQAASKAKAETPMPSTLKYGIPRERRVMSDGTIEKLAAALFPRNQGTSRAA